MNDQLLEKIKNHVLNNMGNKEFMHLISYLETRQDFYTQNAELKALVRELVEACEFYGDGTNYSLDDYCGISGEMRSRVVLYGDSTEVNDVASHAGRRAREVLSKNKELIEAIKGE